MLSGILFVASQSCKNDIRNGDFIAKQLDELSNAGEFVLWHAGGVHESRIHQVSLSQLLVAVL